MSHFREEIHYNKDRVMFLWRSFKSYYEVHTDILPRTIGGEKRHVETRVFPLLFGQLTSVIGANYLSHTRLQTRPIELTLNLLYGFITSKMSDQASCMNFLNYKFLHRSSRNTQVIGFKKITILKTETICRIRLSTLQSKENALKIMT